MSTKFLFEGAVSGFKEEISFKQTKFTLILPILCIFQGLFKNTPQYHFKTFIYKLMYFFMLRDIKLIERILNII